jgi:bifunctional non-homologous end joining protein LigD
MAASLKEYRRKRDFKRTREPAGGGARAEGRLAFVIQKHHASHLHFDLRLEVDDVMKSWAVPKGPSRDPSVKRLAMQVEDHPIAYNAFEGTIPKGEYGGGTVMIWDRGTYSTSDGDGSEDAVRAALDKGTLKLTLHGERLNGTWTLVRTKRDRQWLLIKHSDEFDVKGDELPSEDVGSVVSGRTMSEIAEGSAPTSEPAGSMPPKPGRKRVAGKATSAKKRASVSETAIASSLLPMLASSAADVPSGSDWAFEPKYDGVRVLAFADGDAVALVSRNGIDKAAQFPEIVDALVSLGKRKKKAFVLDGEVVPRKGKSIGRFQDLQQRIGQTNATTIAQHVKDAPVALVAFDLLLDGTEPLVDESWTTRRKHLDRLVSGSLPDALILGDVDTGASSGTKMLAKAKRAGWEGIMAKRTTATYRPGERTKDWRKIKIEGQQEFVVGGWTEPKNSRQHLGALLVGYWDGDDFVYAGRVGGGFTGSALAATYAKLHPLERKTSPFAVEPPREGGAVHWTKPEVVVEVKFNEWTSDGRLRQPIFLGVRDDKEARAVIREAAAIEEKPIRSNAKKRKGATSDPQVLDALSEIEKSGGKGVVDVPNAGALHVTNLGKLYFPEVKRTKGDLMRYYDQVAPALLPFIADRPLVLKRYPDGVSASPFFQQNASDDTPEPVRVETVPSESTPGRRLIGGDLYTLLYCTQLGCIDVNPWHSRIGSLECPDYTILDLDPGPKATFATIVQVAKVIKELLDAANLVAGIKTSGSRGLHIVIPLPSRTNEEASKLVAQILAEQTVTELPKVATTVRSVSARPAGAVYVDYLQNIVGKSVASVFSVRPREDATVSAPIAWEELTSRLNPKRFTMDVVVDELEERAAMWRDAMAAKNRLDALS